MYKRDVYSNIKERCFQGKAILLLGARQVGKTTLLKELIQEEKTDVLFLNCDDPQVVSYLTGRNLRELQTLVGEKKFIVIDEAQKVNNIGLTLKLILDNMPDVQVIATGSSAFELRNRQNEPLTGRKFEYQMFPISTHEILQTEGLLDVKRLLETRLIYGSYPDILTHSGNTRELLTTLIDSYLYKDILSSDNLRKPEALDKLLRALALQVGSEVSYNELAQVINSDTKTVERYIDLLEKCFIIFRLHGLSRNLRNELKRAKKIYFTDNGVRNAVIQQFAPMDMRNDIGQLWENFFISERIKRNHYMHHYCNIYFWRTTSQQEIDYIEETDGQMSAFEMKWNPKKKNTKIPASFLKAYDIKETATITPDNYLDWLI
ncbi:MAG: ATP-binding protein [Paludibacteraceae bacterium]|nr:ATP-binding protein [Paludibacteraceae bacterium]